MPTLNRCFAHVNSVLDSKPYSRNLKDATKPYATIGRAVSNILVSSAVFDGEFVAVDAEGRALRVQALHHQAAYHLAYYIFDVLHLNGVDLTSRPLAERRGSPSASR